jgi:hypothetical protein
MQHNVVGLLLSIAFALAMPALCPRAVQGDGLPAAEPPPLAAVVLLSSAANNVCGTGFIGRDGRIVTNKHLADSLCPTGPCTDLRIRRSAGLDRPADIPVIAAAPRVRAAVPALDVAVIDPGTPPTAAPPHRIAAADAISLGGPSKNGDEVTTLGFPRCGPLRLSRGRVLTTDQIRLATDLRGAPGQSGAPILNRAGAATGIVDEATDIGAALTALATGGTIELRGRRLDTLDSILTAADQRIPQLHLLLDLVRSHRSAPRGARLRVALDFVIAAEDIVEAARAASPPDPIAAVLSRGEEILTPPYVTLSPPTDPHLLLAEAFTVAYATELGSAPVSAWRIDRYRAALAANGRESAHLLAPPTFPSAFDLNAGALALLILVVLSGLGAIAWVVRRVRRAA